MPSASDTAASDLATVADSFWSHRAIAGPKKWRKVASLALAVLTLALIPLVNISVWSNSHLYDRRKYLNEVTPLAANATVLDALSTKTVEQLYKTVDVEARVNELTKDLNPLIGDALRNNSKSIITETTRAVFKSSRFKPLWIHANELVYQQTIGVNRVDRGDVILDVHDVLVDLDVQLRSHGVTLLDPAKFPPHLGVFRLVSNSELEKWRHPLDRGKQLAVALPLLAALSIFLCIWVSNRRAKAALLVFLGCAAASLATPFVMSRVRASMMGEISDLQVRSAATVAFNRVMSGFFAQTAFFAFGFLILAGTSLLISRTTSRSHA